MTNSKQTPWFLCIFAFLLLFLLIMQLCDFFSSGFCFILLAFIWVTWGVLSSGKRNRRNMKLIKKENGENLGELEEEKVYDHNTFSGK